MLINDGNGTGISAGVSAAHELLTHARTITHAAFESRAAGRLFFVATDFVALTTTASYSAIAYLKNTSSTHNIFLHRVTASSTVTHQWRLLAQPTAGTIIDDGTAASKVNANLTSSLTLAASAFKGADAKTFTDGTIMQQWASDIGRNVDIYDGEILLGPNDAVGFECKPSASCDVGVTIIAVQELIT